MKGGYHPLSRLEQELAEISMEGTCYVSSDAHEDGLIERLLSWARGVSAHCADSLAALERWERAWRKADARADQSVAEMHALAVSGSALLSRAREDE